MTGGAQGPAGARTPFPPQTLRQYALLADGERGALIGPHGNIVWMCAPMWHDDAVFSALLGGQSGYAITPVEPYVWGGYYEAGSLIWHSRWVTHGGIIESREALAFPGDPHRTVILRRISAVDADARVQVVLDPRARFDKEPMSDEHRESGIWTARTGSLHVRWSGAAGARRPRSRTANGLVMDMRVPAGEYRDLILELSDQGLPDRLPTAAESWSATEKGWSDAVPDLGNCHTPQDAQRSYAVLRGLTSRSGGMVAAATTSLPERAEAGRNYDYRYVWIRDQCYAGQAVAAAGDHPLLASAVRFVGERLLADADRMAPAYTSLAEPVPDQHRLDLPGYPGGQNRIGNWVNRQFQLDVFGESLLLFAAAAQRDRMTTDAWRAASIAVDAIANRWTEPDAGIWEIDNQRWTHSRLICAAGLRALAEQVPPQGAAANWLTLADKITAETSASSLHVTGRWQRSPDDAGLDAALLLPALRGAVPADDPRTLATLAAYQRELTVNGYAYRFRHDGRPLADAEGAFTFCGFLLSLALNQQHHPIEAAAWYERTRSCCGPPQLYSEEYDATEFQMRGNLPQAFVHALHLEATARLNPPDSVLDSPATPAGPGGSPGSGLSSPTEKGSPWTSPK